MPRPASFAPVNVRNVVRGAVSIDDVARALCTQKGVMPRSVTADAKARTIDVVFGSAADLQKAQAAFPSNRYGTQMLDGYVVNLSHRQLPPGA